MGIPLRLLLIEDSADDATLLLREIKRGGFDPLCQRVDTYEDTESALQTQNWDIIISDYSMPNFNGMEALKLAKDSGKDLPFILISGTIGEEYAVRAMKAGANDYLMKDNLTRLIPAIERELKEAKNRNARKRAEETIEHLTYHDALTGLLNRREFERRVASALESAKIKNLEHALCYFDLDQFKVINDTCGHLAGDELLKQLSDHLLKRIQLQNNLARLGGDEFGILIKNCSQEKAKAFAATLCGIVSGFRFVWDGDLFEISASIGLVNLNADTESLSKVLSAADAACYMAKDAGRNRFYLYEDSDVAISQRHNEMQMVSRITRALKGNRMRLYSQSIMPLKDPQEPPHCEILLRMLDEDGNLLAPGQFMPAAEKYSLMPSIDRWVIDNVFALKAYIAQKRQADIGVYHHCSINLSGASLSDDTLLGYICDKTREYDIAPSSVCFEITETAAIANLPIATAFIKELRSMGYRFALDDFGSGLSSFAYLKNLPVDFLKIDGSFIKDIASDPIDYTMVRAINQIGHAMNIKTIAEFVEDDKIVSKLHEIGVDFAQGFGIDRPRPIEEMVPGFSRSLPPQNA